MKPSPNGSILIDGREVGYRVVESKSAKRLRIRVGMKGVEVVRPTGRTRENVTTFVAANGTWILNQLDRIEALRPIRRPTANTAGTILFHGERVPVTVVSDRGRGGANQVVREGGGITIIRGGASATTPAKSLENWLRKQARADLLHHLKAVLEKLKRRPGKVFVMGQRTKWGNCSSKQNLSFNWRLVMAPEYVLHYIVTHECVHLAIPDHSQKFWLSVQSMCKETERAKQWLSANGQKLLDEFTLD